MCNILGVDPSLNSTGVVCLSGAMFDDGIQIPRFPATSLHILDNKKELSGIARLVSLRERFEGLLAKYEPELVVIEGYAMGKTQGREAAGELGGLLRLACHDSDIPFVVVSPPSLKQFTTGKGNCQKDVMRVAAYKRWKLDVDHMPSDVIDAYALAMVGVVLKGYATAQADYQTKVIRQISSNPEGLQQSKNKVKVEV